MDAREHEAAPERATRRQCERIFLRAICSTNMNPGERTALLARLSGYEWLETEHRVVCDAIVRCREMDAASMRAELQSTTTRLGFPDLDLSEYLREDNAADMTAEEAERVLEALLGERRTGEE